jgi:alpha-ketoglutarate-dependent taurine dioxygenase
MSQLKIRALTPAFGAEIENLDPRAALDDEERALLRRTFDERGLLIFRGLELDAGYQRYLAATVIGKGGSAADGSQADTADPYYVSNREEGGGAPYGRLLFHSDMMWAETPFQVLTLWGQEVEEPTVPTVFTSAAYAWTSLPDDLRTRVAGRHAVHTTGQQLRGDDAEGELLHPVRGNVQSTTKPIAYPHPRTGMKLLYVSQMMTSRIAEVSAQESEELLEALFAHLYNPATLWQQDWHAGDLVMWDNYAIQHARGNVTVEGPTRTLRKVIAPRPSMAKPAEKPRFSKVGG